jgi:hypothetical protein
MPLACGKPDWGHPKPPGTEINARGFFFKVDMDDQTVAALLAAGRLLQSKQWFFGKREIKRMEGETYPAAVMRTIETLDAEERNKLRELTQWVRDYERTVTE